MHCLETQRDVRNELNNDRESWDGHLGNLEEVVNQIDHIFFCKARPITFYGPIEDSKIIASINQ